MENKVNSKVIERNKIIQNQYEIGNGGIFNWFLKVFLLLNIQIKKLFKTPMILFGIFGIPLILLFGVGALVQDGSLLTPCFGMEAIVVAGIIFGDLYYSMEKSTMEKSTNTSNYGHKTKLFTIALTTLIVSLIAIFTELFVFILFELLDIFFMPSFMIFGDAHYQSLTIEWLTLQWGNLIYYITMNILLTISIFILFKNFFKSNKTFIMFVLVYVLLDIMFGGILIMNYNQAVVKIDDEGNLVSTGYLANNNVLLGKAESAWSWNSWYSITKFIVPHYFLNQQFSTLLKAGSVQQTGASWFDINGVYHMNWDIGIGISEEGEAIVVPGYSWMLSAQRVIFNDSSIDQIYNNKDFAVLWNDHLINDPSFKNNVILAFTNFNRTLPSNASFWKPYNNDYTFILSETLPWVYSISMGWIGFGVSRLNSKK